MKPANEPNIAPIRLTEIKRLVLPYALKNRINILLGLLTLPVSVAATLFVPWLTVDLVDNYFTAGRYDGLVGTLIGLGGIIVTVMICDAVFIYNMQKVGHSIIYRMRRDLFNHCMRLPRTYFDNHPIGITLTRLTSDFETFGESIAAGVLSLISDVFKTVILLGILYYLNFELALIFTVMMPLAFLVVNIARRYLHRVYMVGRSALAKSAAYLQECLSGIKTIQLYAAELEAEETYRKKNLDFLNPQKTANILESFLYSFIDGFMSLCVAVIIAYAAFGSFFHAVSAGVLLGFVNSMQKIFVPIREFSQQIAAFQRSFAALSHINDTFRFQPETSEKNTNRDSVTFNSLVFDRVSFRYAPDKPLILNDISFHLEKNQKIALVGATGSGKSTIIRLISKQYEGYTGSIKINGRELSRISKDEIRDMFAVMHQDYFLFPDTLGFNIGLERETVGEAEIKAAAQYVTAHDFIETLPEGYGFHLQNQGENLSAGESQLVAFARAVASNSPVFILDEATGKIDSITEHTIEQTIERLMKDRTTIVIAHRLSTIRKSDLILVMKNGQILERGTHQSLLAQDGYYAALLGEEALPKPPL